jgi:hypothetical protein
MLPPLATCSGAFTKWSRQFMIFLRLTVFSPHYLQWIWPPTWGPNQYWCLSWQCRPTGFLFIWWSWHPYIVHHIPAQSITFPYSPSHDHMFNLSYHRIMTSNNLWITIVVFVPHNTALLKRLKFMWSHRTSVYCIRTTHTDVLHVWNTCLSITYWSVKPRLRN